MMADSKKTLTILFGILLLDLLAFTCILPLFPVLMDFYGTKKDNAVYLSITQWLSAFKGAIGVPDTPRYNSVFFGGLLGSLFSFLQFLACPIAGAAADRYGRKPLFLLSALGSLASYILWSMSGDFTTFLISRIVGGLSKTSVSIATTIATDVSEKAKRSRGVVVVGLAFSISFLIGPMFGAYFAMKGRKDASDGSFFVTPSHFAIGMTILEIASIIFLLPETLPIFSKTKKSGFTSIFRNIWLSTVRSISKNENAMADLKNLGRCYFIHVFIYSGLEFVMTFLVHLRYGYTSMEQGRMFLLIGSIMILIQGGLTRRVATRRQRHLAVLGVFIAALAFIAIGSLESQTGFYFGIVLHSVASGIVVPSLTTMVSCFGSEEERGQLLGIFRSLGYLARAFGPFTAAAAFWLFGPSFCYLLGGFGLIIPLALLIRVQPAKDASVVDLRNGISVKN